MPAGDHVTPAPIARSALHEEVAERLRDMIVEGTLASGERLNERELCARFGISRTPFREALLVLAGEGLVELAARRGARVAALEPGQVHDLLELLGGLEALAGELACRRADEAAIAAIDARHQAMIERYRAGDMLAYFKLNEAIHDAIVAASANAALTAAHRPLRRRIQRALYMPNIRPERWRAAIEEHEGFIAALGARDGGRLAALLRRHNENTWQELRLLLENGDERSPDHEKEALA